ncbi:MAG TPA: hypothetical protein VN868_11115 [Terriglobales bacterium]|jgi:hypothetical protein|nr:hypothetical protein [Terriglobales bacterium]
MNPAPQPAPVSRRLFFAGAAAPSPTPLLLVLAVSVVVGLLMVLVFRYTSDQKAIGRAKDRLKAHLLAVRLFQDQLPVVMRAYTHILMGTGSYLRLAFTPFLIAILPITFLIIQLDRYLGWMPITPQQNFLVEARVTEPQALNQVTLQLPPQLSASAPAVHLTGDKEVVWRLVAERAGQYDVNVAAGGQTAAKQVVVSPGLARVSPIRLQDNFWARMLMSGEPALATGSPVQSIAVTYPPRIIRFAWLEWNWIALFFVVSLMAGFFFKTVLGIQV